MSAQVIDIRSRFRAGTLHERVRDRLRGMAWVLVRPAIAFAESFQRKTNCADSDAVAAGVRWAKQRAGQHGSTK